MVAVVIHQKFQLKRATLSTIRRKLGMFMLMAPATSMIIRMVTNIPGLLLRRRLQRPNQKVQSKANAKRFESGENYFAFRRTP